MSGLLIAESMIVTNATALPPGSRYNAIGIKSWELPSMSILEGIFRSKEDVQRAITYAREMVESALPHLPEVALEIIKGTSAGSSLGDALGVTKKQKGALLDIGCRLVQLGEPEKAIAVLTRLSELDPLEERAYYAIGVACQAQGRLRSAAQMYLQFLALDATNPTGYLRLGECLWGAGEHDEARSAFVTARRLVEGAPGGGSILQEIIATLEKFDAFAAVRSRNGRVGRS